MANRQLYYLPEKKRLRIEAEERVKNSYKRQKESLVESSPGALDVLDLDELGPEGRGPREEVKRESKPQPRLSNAQKERDERKAKIAANVAREREKLEAAKRARKRQRKRQQLRRRTKKGNPVMKFVIDDMLERLEKGKTK